MAQPTYGAPWRPLADVYGQQWVFEPLTSDPANTENGDHWLRVDLDSGDKLATLRWDHGSGIWDIPVFPVGTSENGVEEVRQVETPNGRGFIPIVDGGAAFQQVGFQHNGTRYGLHDSPFAIPDSALYRYPLGERSTPTLTETINNEDATSNGTTNVSGNWIESFAESGDGTGDYISGPSAWASWIETSQNQWLAFTVDADPANQPDTVGLFGFIDSGISPSELWRIGDRSGNGVINWEIRDSGGNSPNLETSNAVLDGNKHRLIFQRTSTDVTDWEIWVDGAQASTTINTSGSFNGSFASSRIDPFFLATNLNGAADQYLLSTIDNIIFGELGTTLSQSEIQSDYDRQPWS